MWLAPYASHPEKTRGRRVTPREAAKLIETIDEGIHTMAALRGLALTVVNGEGE